MQSKPTSHLFGPLLQGGILVVKNTLKGKDLARTMIYSPKIASQNFQVKKQF